MPIPKANPVIFYVDTAGFQHIGIHHPATQNFNPAGIFTNVTSFATTDITGDIHFCRWFGKRKIRWAEPDFGMFTEKLAGKIEKRLFQIGKRHILVHIKTLNLMKYAVSTG